MVLFHNWIVNTFYPALTKSFSDTHFYETSFTLGFVIPLSRISPFTASETWEEAKIMKQSECLFSVSMRKKKKRDEKCLSWLNRAVLSWNLSTLPPLQITSLQVNIPDLVFPKHTPPVPLITPRLFIAQRIIDSSLQLPFQTRPVTPGSSLLC